RPPRTGRAPPRRRAPGTSTPGESGRSRVLELGEGLEDARRGPEGEAQARGAVDLDVAGPAGQVVADRPARGEAQGEGLVVDGDEDPLVGEGALQLVDG